MAAQYANLVIPPASGVAGASLIASCDPTLYGLGVAFQTVLRAKLDAAWQAAAQQLKAQDTAHVVEDLYFANLNQDVSLMTWKWPALAIWRDSEKWTQRTLVWDSCEAVIKAIHVLPPLTREHYDRVAHIRRAVSATLRAFIEAHHDASYSGDDDFLAELGIESLALSSVEYGIVQSETNTQAVWPATQMTFELRERAVANTTGLATMTRIDTDLESSDDTTSSDVVATSFDPTTA